MADNSNTNSITFSNLGISPTESPVANAVKPVNKPVNAANAAVKPVNAIIKSANSNNNSTTSSTYSLGINGVEPVVNFVNNVNAVNAVNVNAANVHAAAIPTEPLMCIICLTNSRVIRFDPCGHLNCCEMCSMHPSLISCPTCRVQINLRQITYIS